MNEEPWIPLKHQMPDGTRLGRLLHSGADWQIFGIDRDNRILLAKPSLASRWIASELLPDTVLKDFYFGDERYRVLLSGAEQKLEPVADCSSPDTKADGLSFAVSLRETRKLESDASLHDAIYAERYSRLLPSWSVSEDASDAEVFGRWLTGGVPVPATSFRRLATLLGWLKKDDVIDLVAAAGLSSPNESAASRAQVRHQEREQSRNASEKPIGRTEDQSVHSAERPVFNLSGRPTLELFFKEHVIDIVENADRYRALGIEFPTAIVLHGPPGCGKTFAVERLVEYLDWPIFNVDSNSVGSPYIHETSRKVSEVFDKAMDAAPSIIVIDEMESYLSDRQVHESAGLHHVEEVAEFLRRIPEANSHQVLVIGMTNRLEMIDSAILRRGRFDHIVKVEMPSSEEVLELIESLLKKVPLQGKIDTKEVVRSLTGRALSDAAFVVREAARLAARAGKTAVDSDSLHAALGSLPAEKAKKRQIGFIQD